MTDLDNKKSMIFISSAMYKLLLERMEEFQRNLNSEIYGSSNSSCVDDVYFRFSDATLCDMLHYQHIKSCQDTQRDIIYSTRDNYFTVNKYKRQDQGIPIP